MKVPWRPRLPVAPLQGLFVISEAAIEAAERLLPTYRGCGGDHEGIVYLCGREFGDVTVLITAVAPAADHGPRHVFCSERDIDQIVTAAHSHRLGVLAQIHSHPGGWTEHSRGDDDLVLMPFEGMLSVVVPHYGRYGIRPIHHMGVHQYQDGRWVIADPSTTRASITVVPAGIDLR